MSISGHCMKLDHAHFHLRHLVMTARTETLAKSLCKLQTTNSVECLK